MTVVSSREFATNQKRYFDMATNEQVAIKRGKKIFYLTYSNNNVDDDAELLTLAKSRRNSGEEYVSIDEFITYMKNNLK